MIATKMQNSPLRMKIHAEIVIPVDMQYNCRSRRLCLSNDREHTQHRVWMRRHRYLPGPVHILHSRVNWKCFQQDTRLHIRRQALVCTQSRSSRRCRARLAFCICLESSTASATVRMCLLVHEQPHGQTDDRRCACQPPALRGSCRLSANYGRSRYRLQQ